MQIVYGIFSKEWLQYANWEVRLLASLCAHVVLDLFM
jgi:hypothetical protein